MDATMMNSEDVWKVIVENPFSSAAFVLLVISEGLASIPSIQSNSVFQLVVGFLKKFRPVK